MNDLIRPALYGAHHLIEPVGALRPQRERIGVVGPVCETADTFARNLDLPRLEAGDLLAMRSTGAYGFAMASTYNGRPRAAEVLIDGDRSTLVRGRESLADLWRGEYHLDGSPVDSNLPPLTEEEA